MVMQVEVRHEESFRSLSNEDGQMVFLEVEDNRNNSMLSMGRDTRIPVAMSVSTTLDKPSILMIPFWT
jgi:hypothetical protein